MRPPVTFSIDGLTPMQLGRLDKALDTLVRIDGEVVTWRAHILANVVRKRESDGMADYSRTRFNRMTGREQEAYMARLKAKRVFIVEDAQGFGRAVPKVIYDAVTFGDVAAPGDVFASEAELSELFGA